MQQTAPADRRQVTIITFSILSLVIGVVTGGGAILLRYLIGLIHNLFFGGVFSFYYNANDPTAPSPFGVLIILAPVIGGLVVLYLVRHFAPEAKGHGVPEVMDAIYYQGGRIRPVVVVIKSLASALSIGSGASVGREGPIIQIGSGMGSVLGQWLHLRSWQILTLVAAGAGAGIAATFNTPLGGVLFAVELMLPEFSPRTLLPVVLATGTATYMGRLAFGVAPSFAVAMHDTPDLLAPLAPLLAHGERIRNLVTVQGVRENQLIGYGLVVGLDGTGDQTTQTPFTTQMIANMLKRFGIVPPANQGTLQLKNVAAVMVTAELPPFARPGQTIGVTVSSLGNAKSLRGGTLLLTLLHGADGKVYAAAQGSLIVSGYGASAGGATTRVNSLASGLIPNGATVERAVRDTDFDRAAALNLLLDRPDFATANRIQQVINTVWGPGTAVAENAGVVRVRMPGNPSARVGFMANIQALEIRPGRPPALVIINPRNGTVVLGADVRIGPVAVAHGNLTVTVTRTSTVSQPSPFSRGRTVTTRQTRVRAGEKRAHVLLFRAGTTLGAVVRALNAVGATPSDLVAILQAMKQAGALHGKLQVM